MDNSDQENKVAIGATSKSKGPLILGIIFIAIGFYFLLERYNLLPPFSTSWPVLIVIVGFALIIGYFINLKRR